MKCYLSSQISKVYAGKPLIVPVYASAKKKFYSFEDMQEFDDLRAYLGEVVDHEADITPDGINFLRDTFGFKKLGELLYINGWYPDEFKSSEAIYDWLVWWDDNTRN